MTKKTYIWIIGIVVILGIFFFLFGTRSSSGYPTLENFKGKVDFYKSESCGCCDLHASYLETKGKLNVAHLEMPEVLSIKTELGIPLALQSCHTATIDGYFVEGHIPLEAIDKLIKEKPDIAGIAMPGMPSGSPGMPGNKQQDFVIYAVKKDGSYAEFMRI